MNLKNGKERYLGRFREKKGKGEIKIISKNKFIPLKDTMLLDMGGNSWGYTVFVLYAKVHQSAKLFL